MMICGSILYCLWYMWCRSHNYKITLEIPYIYIFSPYRASESAIIENTLISNIHIDVDYVTRNLCTSNNSQ